MPYFPHKPSSYKCEGCNRWFTHGLEDCLVAHSPGTCCHYGEREVSAPPSVTIMHMEFNANLSRLWKDGKPPV